MNRKIQFIICCLFILSCGKRIHNIPPDEGQAMQDRILTFLNECEEEGFAGAVLVQIGDSILIQEGYGYSNKGEKTENLITTIFDIGSVTKQFTAAAILKLEMNGLIRVSNSIGDYIPELNAEKSAISIHQLLTQWDFRGCSAYTVAYSMGIRSEPIVIS